MTEEQYKKAVDKLPVFFTDKDRIWTKDIFKDNEDDDSVAQKMFGEVNDLVEGNEDIDDDLEENYEEVKELQIKDLILEQNTLSRKKLEGKFEYDELPSTYLYDSKYLLIDGYHRTASEVLKGNKKCEFLCYDVDKYIKDKKIKIEKSVDVIIKGLESGKIIWEDLLEKGVHKYIRKEIKDGKVNYIYEESKVKDKNSNFDVEKIKKYAEQIISGEKSLERLSQEEERGRIEGGRRNVEATLLLRANEGTSEEDKGEGLARKHQIDALTKYAKEENIWHDDLDNFIGTKNHIDGGSENEVYKKDDNTVYKINNLPGKQTPLDFLDKISLHNYLFPDVAYKVTGFGKDKKGKFSVLIEQPFITATGITNEEDIKADMLKRGFNYDKLYSYSNDNYAVSDLKEENVLTNNGKLYYIDPFISKNGIKKSDGIYFKNFDELEEKDSITKSQASLIILQKDFELGKISQDTLEQAVSKFSAIEKADNKDYGTGKHEDQIKVTKNGKTFYRKQVVGKKQGEQAQEKVKYSDKELADHAKTASQQDLERHIKEGNDPELRAAAHKELDRRSKEEHVQEPKEKKKPPVDKQSTADTSKTQKKPDKSTESKGVSEKPKDLKSKFDQLNKEYIAIAKETYSKSEQGDITYFDSKEYKALSYRGSELIKFIQKTKQFNENDLKENIKKFKELFKNKEPKDLLGDGDLLALKIEEQKDSTVVNAIVDDAYISRIFYNKDKSISMNELILDPIKEKGNGVGSSIFKNQVNQFKDLGFNILTTLAAKSKIENGYYTWARLGYAMSDKEDIDRFKKLIENSKDKKIKSATSLNKLMTFKKGRDFWKQNGFTFEGLFDLSDKSDNIKILKNYKKNGK